MPAKELWNKLILCSRAPSLFRAVTGGISRGLEVWLWAPQDPHSVHRRKGRGCVKHQTSPCVREVAVMRVRGWWNSSKLSHPHRAPTHSSHFSLPWPGHQAGNVWTDCSRRYLISKAAREKISCGTLGRFRVNCVWVMPLFVSNFYSRLFICLRMF